MLFYGLKNNVPSIEVLAMGFLMYNVIAFGLQPFIGYICDSKRNIPIAAVGCCLLIAGLVLIKFSWVSLVICALGNACFHVGGGVDSLVHANGRMSRSGIFVSSGALGVTLGTIAGKSGSIPLFIPILLMFLSCILIVCFVYRRNTEKVNSGFQNTGIIRPFPFILALLFISIVIRSLVGSIIPLDWRTTAFLVLLPGIGSFVGKAAGGFLADLFGAKNVGVASLLVSIPFLCLGNINPVFCSIGIILFNMTMPITLCAVASRLPQNPGLAFGLTTLWLLCGNLPTFFIIIPAAMLMPTIALLIALSAVCIYISIINQGGLLKNEKVSQTI